MHTTEAGPLALAVNAIERQGYAIMDDYLSSSNMAALATIVKEKWFSGQMVSAKTGKAALKNQTIRGDFIAWLDENDSQPAVQAYFRQMELLRLMLNMQLLMNVQSLEAHVAAYPVGSVYQKHLDQFNNGATPHLEQRQLSASLYLNPNWQAHHGGALMLHLAENTHIDILPKSGRIVLFLSAKFWHEVLPATRERLSLTGWFRTREQSIF